MQEENSRTEIFLLVEDDEIRSRIETVMAWQIKQPYMILAEAYEENLAHLYSEERSANRLLFADIHALRTMPISITGSLQQLVCVLVLAQPDFFILQEAMRIGVTDCLLYPFTQEELSSILEAAHSEIIRREHNEPQKAELASRYLFWRYDVNKLRNTVTAQ